MSNKAHDHTEDPWADPFAEEAPVSRYAHTCCPPREEREEDDWLRELREQGEREDGYRLAHAYLAVKAEYPTSPESHVWQWAEDRALGERLMDVHAEREARGEFLPLRDGATDVDLDGITIGKKIVMDADGKPHTEACYEWNGEDFGPIRPDLEARLKLEQAVVDGAHASGHMDYRVEFCTPCELRSRGWTAEDGEQGDGSFEEHIRTETVMARTRRHLWRGQLPKVRAPQEEVSYLDLSELARLQPAGYLVEGLIPHQAVGILRARDGMGKTFIALDLAMAICSGEMEWHGREIDPGTDSYRGIYLMGEGAANTPVRVEAWKATHPDADIEELEQNLLIRPGSVNLFTGGPAYERLYTMAKELQPELIVIDTLQTNTPGMDSNSASDAAIVGERLRALQRASGGTVLVLAHTGKSDKDVRGSSALEDDSDFVLHVADWNAPGRVKVDITKQKDGPLGSFSLGVRKAGESIALVSSDEAPEVVWSSKSPRNLLRVSLRQQSALGTRTAAEILDGIDAADRPSRSWAYKELATMVEEKEILLTKTGTTNRYELNPDYVDPMTGDDFDPLEG